MSELKDFYGALGVQAEATPDQVEAAYRQAAQAAESYGGVASSRRALDVDIAYAVVGSAELRRLYDLARLGDVGVLASAPAGWFLQAAPGPAERMNRAVPASSPLGTPAPLPAAATSNPWEWKAPGAQPEAEPMRATREMFAYRKMQERLGCVGGLSLAAGAGGLWMVTDSHLAFIAWCVVWAVVWGVGMSMARSALTMRIEAQAQEWKQNDVRAGR